MANHEAIDRAFSQQAAHFDEDDQSNLILQDLRNQIYEKIDSLLKRPSRILELNSGTGIDALHFVKKGYTVHATDLSAGMITQIHKKITLFNLHEHLTVQKISYTQLDQLKGQQYDLIFSNFGGLNCIPDLSEVSRYIPDLLKPNGYLAWVIMPPICLWEIMGAFKGNRSAFRRFSKDGAVAHLEGEYFKTWYHSLAQIKKAVGPQFRFIESEGVAALSPPPHRYDFPHYHPYAYSFLRWFDSRLRNQFPFNRWADHILVTFQLKSS